MNNKISLYKIILFKLFILISLFSPSTSWTAIYYIDALNGNDANKGVSRATAWQTIEKVNRFHFDPGDQILLKRGQSWKETLKVSSSGSNELPIIYGAYGSGNKPIIDGSDIVKEWIKIGISGTIYKARTNKEVNLAFFNGSQLRPNRGAYLNLNHNEFDWDSNYLYVNVVKNPANGVINASQRTCAVISEKRYITIENIHFMYGERGIAILGSDSGHVTVKDCLFTKPYYQAVYNEKGEYFYAYNNTMIGGTAERYFAKAGILSSGISYFVNNDVSYFRIGLQIEGNVNEGSINNNHVYQISNYPDPNLADCQGIELTGKGGQVSNITLNNNLVHDCSGGNIAIYKSSNNKIYSNIVYNCSTHRKNGGIQVWVNSNNNLIANNTIYNSHYSGIMIDSTSSGNTVINNIVYLTKNGHGLWISENNTNDYNCIYLSEMKAWKGRPPGAHSFSLDPEFVDVHSFNFNLKNSSPCIDNALNIGLSEDFAGTKPPQGKGMDIGAFEFLLNQSINSPRNLRLKITN